MWRVCCCGPCRHISINCCMASAHQQLRAVSHCQLMYEAGHRLVAITLLWFSCLYCHVITARRQNISSHVAGSCRVPLRYTVATLGFIGFFCAYASRGCINVAIVAMVNSTDDDSGQLFNSSADRCPPPQNVTVRPSSQVYCRFTLIGIWLLLG